MLRSSALQAEIGLSSEAKIYRFMRFNSEQAAIFRHRVIMTATVKRTRQFSVRRMQHGLSVGHLEEQ